MAEMARQGDDLVLTLTTLEKAESVHGDVRVPMTSVRDVEIVDDIIDQVHGMKMPGTSWPGKFMIGTLEHASEKKSFVVIHHDQRRGVRVRLEGAPFGELLVGCDDPEAVRLRLTEPT